MNRDIRELMERWSRWRHYRHGGHGKTMTGKLLEGMPGTNCPSCAGRGKLAAYPVCPTCAGLGRVKLDARDKADRRIDCEPCQARGETDGRTCLHCHGRGYRVESYVKVNPAFIPMTYHDPDDPVSQRIDRLVCELRQRDELLGYFFVIWAEYCDARGGTQAMKARRLGLSEDAFKKRLQRAVEWIGEALTDKRECKVIPFPYKCA